MIDDIDLLHKAVWENRKISSIDDLTLDPELERERKNFKFPKDFSFKDEKFRQKVDHLYGKKHFEINYFSRLKEELPKILKSRDHEELGDILLTLLTLGQKERKIKKAVRAEYQEKCKEYFVEQHHWPESVAKLTSKVIGLPKCTERKTIVGYAFSAFPAAIAGNLPKRYVEPISKLMNVERKFLTSTSIAYDIANLAVFGSVAYALWTGEPHREDIIEKMYGALNIGKDVFKYMITLNVATRALEIPVRLGYYIKDKSHTYSPASFFPLNPNFIDGIPFTYLLRHDTVMKVREKKQKYEVRLRGTYHHFEKKKNPPLPSPEKILSNMFKYASAMENRNNDSELKEKSSA